MTDPRVGEEGVIPEIRPGETLGPFEIDIPFEAVFYGAWMARTTRWERLLIRLRLMNTTRRRAVYERFCPLLEKMGRSWTVGDA